MKLSDFLRVKKFTLNLKDSEINFVKPEEILRSAGCMVCKVGRLINLGNECTSETPTGNERPCLHSFRYGSDIELARQCQTTVRCDHCGYTSSSRWTDYVWECHGFSR